MKKIILKTTVKVFEEVTQLPDNFKNLMNLAHSAVKTAYAPYSNFFVGAAVLLENEEMIIGSNQENAAYSMCLCAERVALAAAASKYPGVPIKAIAITAKSNKNVIDQPVSPCGACRQSLCESELQHQSEVQILLQGETGPVYLFKTAKDLLPFSFDGSYL
jgi:cytidine deaminase